MSASASDVFAVLSDMSRNTEWQNGMRRCEWTSPPPPWVGATYDQEAAFMGRKIETSFEVVEFDEGERIRIVSTASTFPLDITRTVIPTDSGCIVSALVQGEPDGLMGLLAPLLRPLVARSVRSDYRRLRDLVEGAD